MFCMVMLAAVAGFRAPAEKPVENERGGLWIEAESFADYGSWEVDTQFTHKMGSAYLICPGADRPTAKPARTEVTIPRAGTWRAWARTKDWLPEFSPGTFALEVNGRRGTTLGALKKGWGWENAGDFELAAGSAELALRDLSGAYARCDAILLTTDLAYVPSDEDNGRAGARPSQRGDCALAVADGGEYDVVVVGAGPGGMGASLGARGCASWATTCSRRTTARRGGASPTPSRTAAGRSIRTIRSAWTTRTATAGGIRTWACRLSAVRVTVTETWGDASARFFEIRVY